MMKNCFKDWSRSRPGALSAVDFRLIERMKFALFEANLFESIPFFLSFSSLGEVVTDTLSLKAAYSVTMNIFRKLLFSF